MSWWIFSAKSSHCHVKHASDILSGETVPYKIIKDWIPLTSLCWTPRGRRRSPQQEQWLRSSRESWPVWVPLSYCSSRSSPGRDIACSRTDPDWTSAPLREKNKSVWREEIQTSYINNRDFNICLFILWKSHLGNRLFHATLCFFFFFLLMHGFIVKALILNGFLS